MSIMKQETAIKNRMMASLFLIILISASVTLYYQHTMISENFDKGMARLHTNISRSFNTALEKLKTNLYIKSDTIVNNKKVQLAFKKQDRKALLNELFGLYKEMVKQNKYIKVMTFRLADGSAFLRLHKPELYGDALDKKRKIIIETNRYKKRLYGFEVGKLEMAYRVVTPIYYKNRYLGLIEIGVAPEYIMDLSRHVFQTKDALFLKQSDGKFKFTRGDPLFSTSIDKIKFHHNELLLTKQDENYLINSDIDFLDYKGKVAAKLLYAYNVDDYANDLRKTTRKLILNTLVSTLVIFFILHYFIQYFINKLNLLHQEIKQHSDELQSMNETLEERVTFEVNKNRDKDQKIIEQSRMAQMGEMISMIAHQWRQPLGSIAAVTATLRTKLDLGKFDFNSENGVQNCQDSLKKSLSYIDDYVKNLTTTIDDFRDFYKPNKASSRELIKIPVLKALAVIKASLESDGVEVIEDFQSTNKITIYENEMMQVVLSILKNASDNFKEKKVIDPKIIIHTNNIEAAGVCLSIYDNGGGISDDVMPKIFIPYFSTKDAKNGTGLGLYMSKTIIEQHHNGEILVENRDDGVAFIINLFN